MDLIEKMLDMDIMKIKEKDKQLRTQKRKQLPMQEKEQCVYLEINLEILYMIRNQ